MKMLLAAAALALVATPAFAKRHCVDKDGHDIADAKTKKECKAKHGKWVKEKKGEKAAAKADAKHDDHKADAKHDDHKADAKHDDHKAEKAPAAAEAPKAEEKAAPAEAAPAEKAAE